MNNFFNALYSSPYGRLLRRFVIVGFAAFLPMFISKIGMDPSTIVDNVLALTGTDWTFMFKLFVGAGIVAGLDKLRREWTNIVA